MIAMTPVMLRLGRIVLAALIPGIAASAGEEGRPVEAPAPFLRVAEEDDRLSLEVAIREYTPADPTRPVVALVGVVHIADRSYYDALGQALGEYPRVLFESVKPAGTGRTRGESEEEKVASTRAGLEFLASIIAEYEQAQGNWPADGSAMDEFLRATDARMIQFRRSAWRDAWGRELSYLPGERLLRSLGRDGRIGGEGVDSDLSAPSIPLADAGERGGDHVQAQLAQAMGLAFQLDSIDYGRQGWQCSDLAMDEVNARLAARGASGIELSETLAGTSMMGKMLKVGLGLLTFIDRLSGGVASEMMRYMLVEMLPREDLLEQGLAGPMGEGFVEVIIDDRNAEVMHDLQALSADGGAVAIFYGAGHMKDFDERLHEGGYTRGRVQWLPAITIDLKSTKLTPDMRRTVKRMVDRAVATAKNSAQR